MGGREAQVGDGPYYFMGSARFSVYRSPYGQFRLSRMKESVPAHSKEFTRYLPLQQ